MTSFGCANSVFKITKENKSLSIGKLGHWNSEDGKELSNKLKKLLEFKSENDIHLHVKEVEKKGNQIELRNNGFELADFDHFKSETLSELKRVK